MDGSNQSNDTFALQRACFENLGRITGGLVHEINNPINYIGNNLRAFQEYVALFSEIAAIQQNLLCVDQEADKDSQELIDCRQRLEALQEQHDIVFLLKDIQSLVKESLDGLERITNQTKNIGKLSTINDVCKVPANINQCISEAINICRNEYKYDFDLEVNLGATQPLDAAFGLLRQLFCRVILNLTCASNSGRILISTCDNQSDVAATFQVTSDNGPITAPAEPAGGDCETIINEVARLHQARVVCAIETNLLQYRLEFPSLCD